MSGTSGRIATFARGTCLETSLKLHCRSFGKLVLKAIAWLAFTPRPCGMLYCNERDPRPEGTDAVMWKQQGKRESPDPCILAQQPETRPPGALTSRSLPGNPVECLAAQRSGSRRAAAAAPSYNVCHSSSFLHCSTALQPMSKTQISQSVLFSCIMFFALWGSPSFQLWQ